MQIRYAKQLNNNTVMFTEALRYGEAFRKTLNRPYHAFTKLYEQLLFQI